MRIQLLLCLSLLGCVDRADNGDARDDRFITDGKSDVNGVEEGSPTALAVISVVNHSTEAQLHDDVGLSANAAANIAEHGAVQTLAELDDIPYVRAIAFHKLIAYAKATGLIDDSHVGTGTLLDCNTSLGPDQQVTVIGDGTKLTLRELTTSGSEVSRTLSTSEWTSHTLHLRDDFGSTTTLTKESGDWIARSTGGGFNETGVADCWVDKSN